VSTVLPAPAAPAAAAAPAIGLSGLPLFAVIDPFFGEPDMVCVQVDETAPLATLQAARAAAWERPVGQCSTTDLPVDPARLPYLVQFQGASDPLLAPVLALAAQQHEDALESGQTRLALGTLIEAELALNTLTTWVEGLCTLRLDGMKRYLRLGSPRTWELLNTQLDGAAMADALGPIHRWHYRARDGAWATLRGRIALMQDSGDEPTLYRRPAFMAELLAKPAGFRLPSQARDCLLKGELISQTLDLLQNKGLRPTPALMKQVCDMAVAQRYEQSRLPLPEQVALCVGALSPPLGADPATNPATAALPFEQTRNHPSH
jgi:hypothetical protein